MSSLILVILSLKKSEKVLTISVAFGNDGRMGVVFLCILVKGFWIALTVTYFSRIIVGLVVVEFGFNQFSLSFEEIAVMREAEAMSSLYQGTMSWLEHRCQAVY